MIALTQVIVPVAPVGTVDDAGFTAGEPAEWVAAFVAQVRAARDGGILCQARVYVSLDVGGRMFPTPLPEIGDWNSPLAITQYGTDNERLQVFIELALPENTVRIE